MLVAKRKYEYYEENADQQKKEIVKKKVKSKRNNKSIFWYKAQVIGCVLVVAAFCVGILAGYAEMSALKYDVYNLNKNHKKMQSEINRLKVEVDKIKRSDVIEQKANTLLGMQYPMKKQMVFLEVDEMDISKNISEMENVVEDKAFGEKVKNVMGDWIYKLKSNINM